VKFPSLFCALRVAVAIVLVPFASSPARAEGSSPSPTAGESLRGKTDQELLDLVMGRTSSSNEKPCNEIEGDRLKTSPLDRLWEMDPRDAALAFATAYVSESMKGMKFKIDNPNARPPERGEIGLRWISGNEYAPPELGVTILKYDGYKSELRLSQVEIAGRASKQEIEKAVLKTDSYPLRRLVAQQTYEILWWLRHVRVDKGPDSETSSSARYSSVDDFGRFWMKPDGPVVEKASFGEPCGQCIAEEGTSSYDSFADTLIKRLIKRSGIKERYPKQRIGTHVYTDEDAKFLRIFPPSQDDREKLKQWIGRLTDILRNPKRQYLHSTVMDVLVPISDPLRYDDDRINDALMEVLHRGLEIGPALKRLEVEDYADAFDRSKITDLTRAEKEAKAHEAKRELRRAEQRRLRDLQYKAWEAAGKLGFHDAQKAFRELFQLVKEPPADMPADDRPLIASASIAARHSEFQAELAKYLGERLSKTGEQTARGTPVIEAIWRADLRELTPQLEQMAALPRPTPNPSDVRLTSIEKASLVLVVWRETDALTKTKLDAMLTGWIGGGSSIPEVLRQEFATLSPQDQSTLRQFIIWMRTVDVGWSCRYLENTFTPHTPRPDILFEM
jgi:hypothetical protein